MGQLIASVVIALASLLAAGSATASTKCQCENGAIVHSMEDGEDACEDACSMFGGGREWSQDEAQGDDGDDDSIVVDADRAEDARDRAATRHPARRR